MARPLSQHEERVLSHQVSDLKLELSAVERQTRIVKEALRKKRLELEGHGESDSEEEEKEQEQEQESESQSALGRAKIMKARLSSHIACLTDHLMRLQKLEQGPS